MNNLICDGNYLLYKNVHTLHKLNRLYGDLWNALDNNITKYTSMNKWDKVILVSDSNKKSWRSKYLTQYKSHRVKNTDIDWDFVFKTYNDWKESHKEDMIILEEDHIEGDDWITSVILKMNKKGKSNVIITSDQDFLQLINYKLNKSKSWINIQIVDTLGKETIYVPEGWQLFLEEFENNRNTDIFKLDNSCENVSFFNRILNNWQYTEINPYEQLFRKVIQGDKSDNIESIYQKLTTTGKIQNIGKGGAIKMWNFYKENYNNHFNTETDEFSNDIINCLENVNKIELTKEKEIIVNKNIKRNIKLIELHYRHYPEWVMEEIIEKLKIFI
jgi:5'-3' exonuclease